ncbi:endonuclease/exonuclease/phosphatase family protein [Acidihalobacter ferrooxydans]|uniref:endonuclease/exonuclease/phosphatase family protein n=1 Tax=Acidihalobacter ferrooxydans TaxID=1765967 RepID=UPI0018DD93C6|nr:endonuclease/exonuclease/phosphatase family protein [Acidihalobacter ferrooxydans]
MTASPPPPSAPPASSSGQHLRLLSYNIQVGITTRHYRQYITNSWKHVLPYPERMDTLRAIGQFIAGFDIVGLQELDSGSLRSGFVDQAEYLAQVAMFPHWYSRTNRRIGHFAQHALGLLGRYRAHRIIEHRLPSRIPGRGALEVHFGHADAPLVVVLLHLSLSRRARQQQFNYVARLIDTQPYVVVMGDLNCQPESREMLALLDDTQLRIAPHGEHTYPSWRPAQSFDHILVSPALSVREAKVYPVAYSDHLPVGLEVLLPPDVRLDNKPTNLEYAVE